MLRPLGNKVLVKKPHVEEATSSGIIVAGGISPQMKCEVVAVGPGEYQDGQRLPLDVKVGDVALLQKGYGLELTIDCVDYILVTEPEIIGLAQ